MCPRSALPHRAHIAARQKAWCPWDAKIGPGRLQDIELLAQAGALIAGQAAQDIPLGLHAAAEAGLITATEAETLTQTYARCWALQCAGRLLSAKPLQEDTLGQAGAAFLARALGVADLPTLAAEMRQRYAQAAAVIDKALAAPQRKVDP